MRYFLFCSFIFLFFFSSCKRELENRIEGSWQYTVEYRYDFGWYDEIIREKGTQIFYEDGTGKQVLENGDEIEFFWEINEDIVTLSFLLNVLTEYKFNVIENKRNEQLWKTSELRESFGGVEYDYYIELNLSK